MMNGDNDNQIDTQSILWNVRFNGRKLHAEGIRYEIETIVEGKTTDEAKMKVYEQYEHCMNFRFEPIKNTI